jgi:hypothetical protein
MRFAIEDLVESAPITFDECQLRSNDSQVEAVRFKGPRLSQPRPRLIEPTRGYVLSGRPAKIEWTWVQPRRLTPWSAARLGWPSLSSVYATLL